NNVRDGRITCGKFTVMFDVHLFDPAKATELALMPVEITRMVAVARGKARLAPAFFDADLFDLMHRGRQRGDPGRARGFVGKIKPGGSGVLNSGGCTEIVVNFDQQVRFFSAHQIEIAQWASTVTR